MNTPEGGNQSASGVEFERVRLLSFGHSNHDWPTFVALLRGAGVTALTDVRSSPYSRWLPYFNKGPLESGLREEGIDYLFLGDQLGGRPESRALYDEDGRVDYERVRQTEPFQRGLERLTRNFRDRTVAFLCSEEDPLDCHRGLMIAPALRVLGFAPDHLRKDGSIETNEEMESRLLHATGVGEGLLDGLFAALVTEKERREMLVEAYRRMARQKAYRLREDDTG
jgi:uncharacterized protein (DUF488 family)